MLSSRVCQPNHWHPVALFCALLESGVTPLYGLSCQCSDGTDMFQKGMLHTNNKKSTKKFNIFVSILSFSSNMTACGTDYLSQDLKSRSYIMVYSFFVYTAPLLLIIYSYFYIVQVNIRKIHSKLVSPTDQFAHLLHIPQYILISLHFITFTGCFSSRKEHAWTSQENERRLIAFSWSSKYQRWMQIG